MWVRFVFGLVQADKKWIVSQHKTIKAECDSMMKRWIGRVVLERFVGFIAVKISNRGFEAPHEER